MKKLNAHTVLHRPTLRSLTAALCAAGLSVSLVSGCDDANSKESIPGVEGAPITAAVVLAREVTETQEFSGRVEAIENVEIRSRVGGYIDSVHFAPGSKVKKGQLLFVIDARPFEAEAIRADAAAASARIKADLARLELSRAEKLLLDKAIAQREFDERASNLKELDANARAAAAQSDTARLNLGYTRVTAPISGRVSKAEITAGNLIDPAAKLTSIVSDDKIYVSFDGDESTYLRVGAMEHGSQTVRVRAGLATDSGFPHEGRLQFVDNQLDAHTGGVRMRALFVNRENLLVPGLFAKVQLETSAAGQARPTAVLINDQAVGTDQNRKFVYVIGAGNKAEYRQISLGSTVDGLRIVRSGLKAGETIVVNGLQRVHAGAALAPQLVAMDAGALRVPATGEPLASKANKGN